MKNMIMKTAKRKKLSLENKYRIKGMGFLLPALIVYVLFMGYPLYRTFALSLTSWSGFGDAKYIGFKNFISIFSDPTFRVALGNTVLFAVASSLLCVALGILLAWLNLYMRRIEGQFFRTIMFAPSMIAPTITGLLFLFIFTEDIGLINNILKLVGLDRLATSWLTNMDTVRPVIIIATVWRQFGLAMVLCYAGLQSIPNDVIESARLDGASDARIFTKIMIPLIKPQIELSMMFTMLGGLKIYDSVVSLTGGGPARQTVVLPMWIIENAYTYSKFGYASALSVAFIAVVLVFIIILRVLFRGDTYEY